MKVILVVIIIESSSISGFFSFSTLFLIDVFNPSNFIIAVSAPYLKSSSSTSFTKLSSDPSKPLVRTHLSNTTRQLLISLFPFIIFYCLTLLSFFFSGSKYIFFLFSLFSFFIICFLHIKLVFFSILAFGNFLFLKHRAIISYLYFLIWWGSSNEMVFVASLSGNKGSRTGLKPQQVTTRGKLHRQLGHQTLMNYDIECSVWFELQLMRLYFFSVSSIFLISNHSCLKEPSGHVVLLCFFSLKFLVSLHPPNDPLLVTQVCCHLCLLLVSIVGLTFLLQKIHLQNSHLTSSLIFRCACVFLSLQSIKMSLITTVSMVIGVLVLSCLSIGVPSCLLWILYRQGRSCDTWTVQQYIQRHSGLHSLYCIMNGMFDGSVRTEQEYIIWIVAWVIWQQNT
ncbi:hypothetical protein VP01_2010g1 [Puccinia sorghi]|uniref:Uncharacterized protein n=1 Tax=Puccinia sorghi TaxID=27349 RepID=A0A0L6VBD3_9BASI|nr:hypothetical protein VP01_2010g1 [Puccinia sorghi]